MLFFGKSKQLESRVAQLEQELNEARMNAPGTLGDNWKWRLVKGQITEEVLGKMRALTRLYGRL